MTELLAPRLMMLRKQAMVEKNEVAKRTLQAVGAAFKQRLVDERLESLTAEQELEILVKMVKQRKESIAQFKTAKRQDLVEKEELEVKVLEEFMPKALTEEEIENAVAKAIDVVGATSMQDMGKVMGKLKPELNGKADMGKVSALVRKLLA